MVRRALLASCLVVACEGGPIDRTRAPTHDFSAPTRVSVRCVPVGGSPITLTTTDGSKLDGELLAASPDELVLLVGGDVVLHESAARIARADVDLYANGIVVGLLTFWAVAGTVSALSHGYLFVASGPTWALASSLAIAPIAADPGRFVTVQSDLGRLYQYARFPGGIPADVDVHAIRKSAPQSCD
jgi:hypothetical protein